MPEPTDHRAEAADWLKHATTVTSHDEAVLEALIGIGHALLAEPAEPAERIVERRMEALAQLFTTGGSMPTAAAIRAALRGEPAPPTTTWHGNQMHRFHVPPVSPSEG